MEKNTIKLSLFEMSSLELIKKVSSSNLTQQETATIYARYLLWAKLPIKK